MLGARVHNYRTRTEGPKDAQNRRTFTEALSVVVGSAQPLKPTEREALDGSLRTRAMLKFYTRDVLATWGPDQWGGELEVDGEWYEVHGDSSYHSGSPLPHNRYVLARGERGEGG